jgi:hypothetical protein
VADGPVQIGHCQECSDRRGQRRKLYHVEGRCPVARHEWHGWTTQQFEGMEREMMAGKDPVATAKKWTW